ncbi:MAG: SDR family NAD(P)-dependent oxidoreductase [Ilumatobacteraceae bacterium]
MSPVALVTGANGGIGTRLVSRLLKDGWCVAALDFSFNNLSELQKDFSESLVTVSADLRNREQIESATTTSIDRFGGLDAIINNAGAWSIGPFAQSTPDQWYRDIDVNLIGPLHLIHLALPHLVQSQRGRIVNVVSDSGRVGEPTVAVYSGAKAGLSGFSRSLAKEIGRDGITVNCVSLSTTVTPAARETYTDDQLKKMVARYPMGRLGTPDDAASMILYLLGPDASWITGQTISVNGGYAIL